MLFSPRTSSASHTSRNSNDSFFKSRVQPKLAVGKPGDKYEVEADKTADKVVDKLQEPKQHKQETIVAPTPSAVVQQKNIDSVPSIESGEIEVQEKSETSIAQSLTPVVQTSLLGDPAEQQQEGTLQKSDEVSVQEQVTTGKETNKTIPSVAPETPPFFMPKAIVQQKAPEETKLEEQAEVQPKIELDTQVEPIQSTVITETAIQPKTSETPTLTTSSVETATTANQFWTPLKPIVQQQKETAQAKEDPEQAEEIQEKPLEEPVTQLMQASADEPTEEAIQAKCDACEEQPTIQQKGEQNTGGSSDLSSSLSASKGSGSPMDESTSGKMSSSFGADFSSVRVHTDSKAVQMNKELGSQAFANGSDIYFNEGKYNPESKSGQHLLAHELTHTVQQGGSGTHLQQKTDEVNENGQVSVPEVDPVPPGAHLLFNPTESRENISEVQAEVGHKSDITNQMEMETSEATNTLSVKPKFEEGKPTVFEPKEENNTEKKLEIPSIDSVNKLDGNIAESSLNQQENIPVSTADVVVPEGAVPSQTSVIESEKSTESFAPPIDEVAPRMPESDDALAATAAINANLPTVPELVTYLDDKRSDEEKRQEQVGYAAQFSEQIEVTSARINEAAVTEITNLQSAKESAKEQLRVQIAMATQQLQAHFVNQRQQLTLQYETALASLQIAKASDLASADALQLEKTTTLSAELTQRKESFNLFVTEQQQQPYVFARTEADRADGELDQAAADCIRQGNEVAARTPGSDDGNPDARASVLSLARQSSDDILAKKSVIREDVMERAADFDGGFGEYQDDTLEQIASIESQLLPAISDAVTQFKDQLESSYSEVESSLQTSREVALGQLDSQEQQSLQQLQSQQEQGLQALESTASTSEQAIETSKQETLLSIGQLGQQVSTLLSTTTGLPNLPEIQVLYNENIQVLQQLEMDGTANLQLIVENTQPQFDGVLETATQEITSLQQSAETQTSDLLNTNASELDQLTGNLMQSMAQSLQGIGQALDQMREEALAGLDQSLVERRSKIMQANSEFGAELHTQVDESIEKAKQPLLDLIIDRLLSASYKAKASWWEGLLFAIADFLIILVVIVLIAAVLVFFEVFATIAAAIFAIGMIVLAIVFIVSLISRLMDGNGWMSILLAISDTIGITAIYQAVTNRDIVTGRDLKGSTFDRWFNGTSGVLQLLAILSPLKSRIPGIKRITFPELPGWGRFVKWIETEGASGRDPATRPIGDRVLDWLFGKKPQPVVPPIEKPPVVDPPKVDPPKVDPPREVPPREVPPIRPKYDPNTRTIEELRTDIDPTPRAGETVAEAAERARLAQEELPTREVMNTYEGLGTEPAPFDIVANDAANGDAHTVGSAGNPGRHGPSIPLPRSLDAAGIPDGTRTIEGRVYGDPPWLKANGDPAPANFSGRWRSIDIINRVINNYLRASWEQVRSDLAMNGSHTNAFPAGEVVGDGYFNLNFGKPGPPIAKGPVVTTVVRITILLKPGTPPSYYVITTFPTISGM